MRVVWAVLCFAAAGVWLAGCCCESGGGQEVTRVFKPYKEGAPFEPNALYPVIVDDVRGEMAWAQPVSGYDFQWGYEVTARIRIEHVKFFGTHITNNWVLLEVEDRRHAVGETSTMRYLDARAFDGRALSDGTRFGCEDEATCDELDKLTARDVCFEATVRHEDSTSKPITLVSVRETHDGPCLEQLKHDTGHQ